jgi:hypothetical protein
MHAFRRSFSTLGEVLIKRGLPSAHAASIAKALEQTVPSPTEQTNYATSLPISALQQLEASWIASTGGEGELDR